MSPIVKNYFLDLAYDEKFVVAMTVGRINITWSLSLKQVPVIKITGVGRTEMMGGIWNGWWQMLEKMYQSTGNLKEQMFS